MSIAVKAIMAGFVQIVIIGRFYVWSSVQIIAAANEKTPYLAKASSFQVWGSTPNSPGA